MQANGPAIEAVIDRVGPPWEELRSARLFITGGTGFVGGWLVASLLAANERHALGARVTLLTRDPEAFARRAPQLAAAKGVTLLRGDARDFTLPRERFDAVIHAAADVSAGPANAFGQVEVMVSGTQRALELARRSGSARFLLVSSGAVYGRRGAGASPIGESDHGGIDPLDSRSTYAEGKHLSEWLVARYAERHRIRARIARCFAILGPGMPMQPQFAASAFVRDAVAGGPVVVKGGAAIRSYLFAADAAAWLWLILLRGEDGAAYNVGSEAAISVRDLAALIAERASVPVREERCDSPALGGDYFVPSTRKARNDLGVREWMPLAGALDETLAWHRSTLKA